MHEIQSACIVEIRGRRAAALTEDGRFVRIKNEGFTVGQTVRLRGAREFPRQRTRFTALASVAAGFLVLLLGGFASYKAPYGVVSVDVNPSVEFTINLYDRVIGVTGVNDDGRALLGEMDAEALLNRGVDTAVEQTIEVLRESGYFADPAENDVVLAASAGNSAHATALAQRLEERIAAQSDLTVLSIPVSRGDVERAHALGASAGRLYLVERLAEAARGECEIDFAAWLERPVREILRETREFSAGPESGGAQGGQTPANTPAPESSASFTGGVSSTPRVQTTPQPGGTGTPGGSGGPASQPPDGGGSGSGPGAGGAP